MKLIRTKEPVLIDYQTKKTGILAMRMEEFKYLGGKCTAFIRYYEQMPNTNGEVGQPLYNYRAIPIKDSVEGIINKKRVDLSQQEADGLFQAIDQSILKSGSFCDQLTLVLTQATLFKTVTEGDFAKKESIDVNLTENDWEIVQEQELIE